MNKKRLWFVLLIILLLGVACGGGEEEPTPTPTPEPAVDEPEAEVTPAAVESEAEEPVTVKMAVYDSYQGLYTDLITAFEEENPDIEVRLVSIEEILGLENIGQEWPDDARRRLVSGADVSDVFYSGQAARDGMLLDLQPFMESDPNFDEADFYPQSLGAFQSEGGTWAIPTELGYRMILFNKDAFDDAGVEYPQAGWSWEEFLATAQAMKQQEGDEVTRWGLAEISPYAAQFVESRVGQMVDMDADPPTINLDDSEVAEALRWYTDLFLTHEVAPYYSPDSEDPSGLNIPEGYLTIESGQAAMWPDASTAYPFRAQQMGLNLGVVPFPVDGPDSATNLLQPSGLSISVGTANPEAAWRWVDYLSRQTTDLAAVLGGRANLPARISVAEASGFWDEVDEELGEALRYAIDHAYTTELSAGIYEAFNEAFESVMAGDKTVEAALADAQVAAEESLDESLAGTDDDEEIVVAADETESPASEDATTVEFIAVTGILEMQTFRDLADQFLEENPDIVVEVLQPNLFEGTPTIADIAGVSDCFQWFPGDFSNPDTQAAILSLDPLLDADSEISADDFYQAVFEAFTAQGQTWGLPGQVNITLIEYNKALFDEAGLDYPSVDWTTDDFLDYAVTLTQSEGETKQYGYVPDLFEPSDMLNMMDRLGAKLIDDGQDPPALALTDPATIAAVRWYTGLTTEHNVKPVLMTSLTDMAVSAVQERESALAQGRAAMWSNSAFNVDLGGGSDEAEIDSGAAPLPAGTGETRGSGYQSATGYFISADTQVREACWEWIKFLTEQPNMGTGMPARQALAESDAFRDQVGPELAEAYLASMANATEAPYSQQIADENSWLNYPVVWLYSAYSQIVKDGLSVEEALENAQQLADEYRACIIEADAFNDEEAQQACMLEVDDTLPAFLFGG